MTAAETKISEAVSILEQVGVYDLNFSFRRKERLALTLLAVANIKPRSRWGKARYWGDGIASPWSCTTREIIKFWNEHYQLSISSGSYDDVRRKNLIYLVEAGMVDRSVENPQASTNNPTRGYALNRHSGELIRSFKTGGWSRNLRAFLRKHGKLADRLDRKRNLKKIKVTLPDSTFLHLVDGEHNKIQKAVIEEFMTRFIQSPKLLYVGDAGQKYLYLDGVGLDALSIPRPGHDKLPDIIAYDADRQWIFFIEAVHSSNPVSRIRHLELETIASRCARGVVYVSAFSTRESFKNWLLEISWETEVWISESPDHLIHFDGDRFLGPYS